MIQSFFLVLIFLRMIGYGNFAFFYNDGVKMSDIVDFLLTTHSPAFKMILENTIIENEKWCFMGKMILDDLRKRLKRLDEDADLLLDNNATRW